MTNTAQNLKLTITDKSIDGVLGAQTQCGKMVGADESTELSQYLVGTGF